MKRVKELDDAAQPNDRIETNAGVPLPCDYFDFIVGTSTGGSAGGSLRWLCAKVLIKLTA